MRNHYGIPQAADALVLKHQAHLKLARSSVGNLEPGPTAHETTDSAAMLYAALAATLQTERLPAYEVSRKANEYQATNEAHQLQFSFTSDTVEVIDPSTHTTWQMMLTRYGYGSRLTCAPPADLIALGNRIEYRRGTLTEWYVNNPLGLEQGFTLQEPPEIDSTSDDYLTFEVTLTGALQPVLAADGQSVALNSIAGTTLFTYGHLLVTDASGRYLPAWFELSSDSHTLPTQLRIVIDDYQALYPIIVDPTVERFFKLYATDGAGNDNFGCAVALNGDTAVIGAYRASAVSANAGKAYVFVRSGKKWVPQATLSADDGVSGDGFGSSVAFDSTTNTAVVGAPTAVHGGAFNIGAAYVFVRSGTTWTQQAKLIASDGITWDLFGTGAAITGDTIMIGATGVPNVDLHQGAVYVYTRSGTNWTQQQRLMPSNGSSGDNDFGIAIAIDNGTAVIGARGFDHGAVAQGSAYIFTGSGGSWSQQKELQAGDGAYGDNFGCSVALSGTTLVIGAFYKTTTAGAYAGAAYIFSGSGASWTQQAKLTASDGKAGDLFGSTVAVGNGIVAVGSPQHSTSLGSKAGTIYIYAMPNGTWLQQRLPLLAVDGSPYTANVYLGSSSALNGTNLLVGAPGKGAGAGASVGAAYLYQTAPTENKNHDKPDCPYCYAGGEYIGDPIGIRRGEKRDAVTDLALFTATIGDLSFTRTYQQGKQSTYQFMGLGWTHNHAAFLTRIIGTPNQVVVQMRNGSVAYFNETTPNHYVGVPGVSAVVDGDISTLFTMTAIDQSALIFNGATGKLSQQVFSNTSSLSYQYDASLRLSSVSNGYGNSLQFSYISAPGQYNDSQLWRVGDQSASGLTLLNPTGRYVEFSYTPQKNNGVIISSPKALLATVRDVLGNLWTYKYYGQAIGETDPTKLDFMTERLSPAVDMTGSGALGSPISLEKLTYTTSGSAITGITQQRGNAALTTAFAFQPNGLNSTTETTAGKTTYHDYENGVYAGATDPAGNAPVRSINPQYRPDSQWDANGNMTALAWSSDGRVLNAVTDTLGSTTNFNYNTGGASDSTLNYSLDAQARKTQYDYGDTGNPRLPTRVRVYDTDGVTILHWQEFSYDSRGHTLNETTYDSSGTMVQQRTIRRYLGSGSDLLQSVTLKDLINPANDQTTTYSYDGVGRVVKTQQSSTFGSCSVSYTVYDMAGNVLASICNYDPGMGADPTTAAQAIALFNPATSDKNRVTTYTYDPLGRRVSTTTDAGASYALTSLTVYDAFDRVVRTISNYVVNPTIVDPYVHIRADFTHGSDNTKNLISETVYNERSLVQKQIDVLGTVALYGYDDAGRLVRTVQSASQPTYNNSYATGGDPGLDRYANTVASSAPDQDIISTSQYDAAGNLVKSTDPIGNVTLTGYDALNRPVRTIRNASQPNYLLAADPTLSSYLSSAAADQDLIDYTEYDALGHMTRTQDVMGSWTLFGYDSLGRQVTTVRSVSQPTYNLTIDPSLANYLPSSNPDQDMLSQTAYDPAGRVLYATDSVGRRSWPVYDGLGRVIRNVANAVGSATNGGVNDPRSSGYNANLTLPDQDLITRTDYDSSGRAWRTQDSAGNWTLSGYDAVNRQVKVVRSASNFAYNAALDVALLNYQPAVGAGVDQDVISQTIYDAQGRVSATLDPLGNQTSFFYDVLGRRIKTIMNYVTGVYNPAFPDQDLTTTTTYDFAGRVAATVDVRSVQTTFSYDRVGRRLTLTQAAGTLLARQSYTCYDKAGRVLRTFQNWVGVPTQLSPDAKDNQGNWLINQSGNPYNLITSYNLDHTGRSIGISDPLGNGVNTIYDKDGQIVSQTDPLNVVSVYRYDQTRRRVKVVQSYQSNGQDPLRWIWNSVASRWEQGV